VGRKSPHPGSAELAIQEMNYCPMVATLYCEIQAFIKHLPLLPSMLSFEAPADCIIDTIEGRRLFPADSFKDKGASVSGARCRQGIYFI
jgi:hypothetical protein